MREPANECRTDHHLQLQWLQQEVQRQGRELDAVATKLQEQRRSLEALKTQLAIVMGSWKSQVRRDLGELIREIDSTNDTTAHWQQLRRQVEMAYPDFARHAADIGADLSAMESKVWMLMGMKLSTSEISTVLNQSVRSISDCRGRISRKLHRFGDLGVTEAPAAGAPPANETASRRPAAQREGR